MPKITQSVILFLRDPSVQLVLNDRLFSVLRPRSLDSPAKTAQQMWAKTKPMHYRKIVKDFKSPFAYC